MKSRIHVWASVSYRRVLLGMLNQYAETHKLNLADGKDLRMAICLLSAEIQHDLLEAYCIDPIEDIIKNLEDVSNEN